MGNKISADQMAGSYTSESEWGCFLVLLEKANLFQQSEYNLWPKKPVGFSFFLLHLTSCVLGEQVGEEQCFLSVSTA